MRLTDPQMQEAFVHEGIHGTRSALLGTHGIDPLSGTGPWRTRHQQPYNAAASELLEGD